MVSGEEKRAGDVLAHSVSFVVEVEVINKGKSVILQDGNNLKKR